MSPLVSIVIPVRNEAGYIGRCVESIYAQDFAGREFEVLIVDGMSDDGTTAILKALKVKYNNLNILYNSNKTVSHGVNIGIRHSVGDIIFRIDAHAEYSPNYIRTCLDVLKRTGAANVGGPSIPLPSTNTVMARAIYLIHHNPFGIGLGHFKYPTTEYYTDAVWPGCFRHDALVKAGLFDERLPRTEDIELNARIRKCGYKVFVSPQIKAWYYCRTKLRNLWRQRWGDGVGIARTLIINPSCLHMRQFVPLLFVSSVLVLAILSLSTIEYNQLGMLFDFGFWIFGLAALRLLMLVFLIYLIAAFFFSIYSTKLDVSHIPVPTSLSEKERRLKPSLLSIILMPVVFITLHVSYGLGTLWGLLSLLIWYNVNRNKRT